MANKIEVNYEDLQTLANRFSQNYDRWHQFVQLLKTRVNHVYATWEGKGADMFEHEMENLVFPAVQRFGHALHMGEDSVKRISQQFQDSEEEAGNLFKADDDGGGALGGVGAGGAAGGVDGQFKFFRPGLRFNEGIPPKFGGAGESGGLGDNFDKFNSGLGGSSGGGVGTGEFQDFNQGMGNSSGGAAGGVSAGGGGAAGGAGGASAGGGGAAGGAGGASGVGGAGGAGAAGGGSGIGGAGGAGAAGGGSGVGGAGAAGGAAGGGGGGAAGGAAGQQPQNFEQGQAPQQPKDESGGFKLPTHNAGSGKSVIDDMENAN